MGFIALIIEFFEISIHEVLAPESCTIPCVIAMLHDIRDNPGHAVSDSSFPIILGCHHLVTDCKVSALPACVDYPSGFVRIQDHRQLTIHGVLTKRESYRSEEHTSELQSLMRNSYAVFCLKKKNTQRIVPH